MNREAECARKKLEFMWSFIKISNKKQKVIL